MAGCCQLSSTRRPRAGRKSSDPTQEAISATSLGSSAQRVTAGAAIPPGSGSLPPPPPAQQTFDPMAAEARPGASEIPPCSHAGKYPERRI
jgi:hypothetical protein